MRSLVRPTRHVLSLLELADDDPAALFALLHLRHPHLGPVLALRVHAVEVHDGLGLVHAEIENVAEPDAARHEGLVALDAHARLHDVQSLRRNLELFLQRNKLRC